MIYTNNACTLKVKRLKFDEIGKIKLIVSGKQSTTNQIPTSFSHKSLHSRLPALHHIIQQITKTLNM